MTFKLWARKLFDPRTPGEGMARRDRPRPPSRPRCVPRVESLEGRLAPATLTVTSLADSGAGTLRAAIVSSVGRTGGGTDTIQFAPGLDGGTVGLTTFVNDLTAGSATVGPSAFFITDSATLVIDGETGLTRGVTIARTVATPFRLFDVGASGSLTVKGLTLSGGAARGADGAPGAGTLMAAGGGAAGMGGAVFILHAARSETSSNSWKLSVISDASLSACVVGMRAITSSTAARKSANVGWYLP